MANEKKIVVDNEIVVHIKNPTYFNRPNPNCKITVNNENDDTVYKQIWKSIRQHCEWHTSFGTKINHSTIVRVDELSYLGLKYNLCNFNQDNEVYTIVYKLVYDAPIKQENTKYESVVLGVRQIKALSSTVVYNNGTWTWEGKSNLLQCGDFMQVYPAHSKHNDTKKYVYKRCKPIWVNIQFIYSR